MNKRKVYQPPEWQIFRIEASNHLLETQSYPGMIDASGDTDAGGFSNLELHEDADWGA